MGKHLKARFDAPGVKRILALDGGGVRGLITIGILEELEAELRQRSGNPNYRLCQYFDLIGGTSTGSIIATGLALGMSVAEISALYKTVIPKVFKRFWFQGIGIFMPMFLSGPLTKALKSEFRGYTLESEELRTGLALHCKRIDTASAWILVNHPDWVYYDSNRVFRLRDLVQASAAAPHFFKGVLLNLPVPGNSDLSEQALVIDGGVGGYNNPALEMMLAATDPCYGFKWKTGPENLYILSIGTGFVRERMNAMQYRRKSFISQTLNALRGMINDVSLQQIAFLQAISVSQQRWYINSEKGDQAAAPYVIAQPAMHYQRMDARIEEIAADKRRPEHAQTLINRELEPKELKGMIGITNSREANLNLLAEIGASAGRHYMKVAAPPRQYDPATW
ncbi:MAG: patatin-like phospholipase family protein [Hyphomonadaceae bacterium]